jgi:hypothetical protein
VSDLAWPEIVDRLAALYRSELHAAGRAAEAPRALAG